MYATNPAAVSAHPRYDDLAAAFAPPPPAGFGDVTADDLGRLSAAERAELLALLEARAAAQADAMFDDRPPIWHFVVADILDHAEESADPDRYVDAAIAHEYSRRTHMERLLAQRAPKPGTLEEFLEWYSEVMRPAMDEAAQLAADDGYPPPGQIVPERKPEPSEAHVPPAAEPAEMSRRRDVPWERPAAPAPDIAPPPPVQPSPPAPVERERPWWTGSGRSDFSGPQPHSDGV